MAKAAKQLTSNEEMPDFGMESFEALLNESMQGQEKFEGQVITGTIIAVDKDAVTVDVGLKSEGRISIREFQRPGENSELAVGDKVDVYVERVEDRNGEAQLSREKARREEAWVVLEKMHEKGERVQGTIFNRVKGGFTVDVQGAIAFLPGSQVDIRPVKDISPLMGTPQPFVILKMDRARGNIVVSRRAILEESRAEARSEVLADIQEGSIVDGIVKNVTDYGAFVDLGGVDGLLHVTDISWSRINHPSEVLSIGQSIKVQVIKFNQETQRISLGMKQLEADPWTDMAARFAKGSKVTAKITNIADYGAFAELGDGVEGLIHVSEMSWTRKSINPSKIVTVGDEVEVVVLDVDLEKRRISLGMKQASENPWTDFAATRTSGDVLKGTVTNTTEFGVFVQVAENLEGMVHVSDLSWDQDGDEAIKSYNSGDEVDVKILEIDADKERISLGIKQLSEDSSGKALDGIKKNAIVTCTITEIDGNRGVHVSVGDDMKGYIKKGDLSRDKGEQRTDRFAVDEKVDAKVITVDKKNRSLGLSIKAKEMDEDKQALKQYGSSDSGASLGDILGAALQTQTGDEDEAKAEKKTAKKPAAKKAPAKKAAAKKEETKTEE